MRIKSFGLEGVGAEGLGVRLEISPLFINNSNRRFEVAKKQTLTNAEAQELVDKGEATIPAEAVVETKKPKAAAKVQKAKVNMSLPTGTHLVLGQPVTLTADDEEHLSKHFSKEGLAHILE